MSETVLTNWINPLGTLLNAPGGIRIGDALKQAAANLELIREPCLEELDQRIGQLDALSSEHGAQPDDAVKLEMYQISNDIHAVAGVVALADLSAAAFSLCELIDRLRGKQAWNKPAIDVHIASLHLLRSSSDEDRTSIVDNLYRLIDSVAPIASKPDVKKQAHASSSDASRSA